VMARTAMRSDIFVDGESALFCDSANIDEYSLKLNILMNDVPLRRRLAENAQDIIKTRFHEDPAEYKAAYRESIEEVFFINEEDEEEVAGEESGEPVANTEESKT
jgi:hypothetical protein